MLVLLDRCIVVSSEMVTYLSVGSICVSLSAGLLKELCVNFNEIFGRVVLKTRNSNVWSNLQ